MSARRGLFCLAVLVVTAAAGGCATTVTGHGSLAANVRAPSADHSGAPSPAPSSGPKPTSRPTSTAGGGDHAGTGKICPLFSAAELTKLFGEPVKTSADKGDDRSCNFQTAHKGGVLVNVYDFLNMKEEAARDPGGKKLTIAGHPAYQGKREILVARSSSSSTPGLIVASNLFFDDEAKGNQIAEKLLEKVVPKFAK